MSVDPYPDSAKLMLVLRMAVRMRDLQKAYFKSRNHVDLLAARKAEKDFDAAAAEHVM